MHPVRRTIPLFPLNIVIFPGSRLPLHIFEERYRTMVTACIENGTEFGINLFEKNHLHPVGCTVVATSVPRRYQDGSFDIVVEGVDRYRLVEYRGTPVGYLEGEVDVFEDENDPPDGELVARAIALYNSILDVAFPKQTPEPFTSTDAHARVSFGMAEKAGLDVLEKQRLLEFASEKRRLEELVRHMENVIPVMREQEQIMRIVANDGYLPAHRKNL